MQANRVIFWDFDGTLGYRPENWSGALVAALNDQHPTHTVTVESLRPFLREGFYWHNPEIPHLDLADPNRYWQNLEPVFVRAYEGAGLGNNRARQAARRVRARCVDPSTYVLYEDTVPTLAALSAAGWRHRMITNHVPELPSVLDALGLLPVFDHIANSGTVGYEKPHPEIFRFALESAGHPREMWMVGDNVVADVLGAEKAGIKGILVRRQDSRARWNCASLQDVMKVIVENDGAV